MCMIPGETSNIGKTLVRLDYRKLRNTANIHYADAGEKAYAGYRVIRKIYVLFLDKTTSYAYKKGINWKSTVVTA